MSMDAVRRKREAVKDAEANGLIADSMAVRLELVGRAARGEIAPEQMQEELKRIKREAKKKGLLTRDQVYRRS